MIRGLRWDQVKVFCGPNKLGPPNNMTDSWDPVGSPDSISLLGLEESLLGGQSFSWSYLGDKKWVGVIRRSVVHLCWENGQLYWCANGPVPLSKKEIEDYLWLDDSYREAVDALPWRSDQSLDQAIKKFSGLRVLRQPIDETLLVFLLSSAKSIPQIKQLRHRIHLNFGEDLGEGRFAFPGWERLSKLSETDARNLGMGYRAKYLVGVAQFLCQRHGWLEEVSGSNYKRSPIFTYGTSWRGTQGGGLRTFIRCRKKPSVSHRHLDFPSFRKTVRYERMDYETNARICRNSFWSLRRTCSTIPLLFPKVSRADEIGQKRIKK